MALDKMKMVKAEKIRTITKYFVVALPENLDEPILVSIVPQSIIEGGFQYYDGTMEQLYYEDELKKLLSEDLAKRLIRGYKSGMKLTLANAFCNYGIKSQFSHEAVKKANKRLHDKLECMTLREFYEKRW